MTNLHVVFHHFDMGSLNVLVSGKDEMTTLLQNAFCLAAGVELSDERYEQAVNKVCSLETTEELKKHTLNYDARAYRRVIKIDEIFEISEDQYKSLEKQNLNKDDWMF